MKLQTTLSNQTYHFKNMKDLLAKANEERSGDSLAGIGAASAEERIAAKYVLSERALTELRNHPVIPYEQDEVTRVINDGLDEAAYLEIKDWTVAELREFILSDDSSGDEIKRIARGLTSEMVAAVAKLMSNLDLVYGASKIRISTCANTTVGLPGTLGSRLQPNHPSDSVEGILAEIYEGLAFGSGDALIGINPCQDNLEVVVRLLQATQALIDQWKIPAQNCVLAHVTTQMEALRRGAPMGILFQSLAGTEKGNAGFGINVALLDEAAQMIQEKSTARGPNLMYFETGQGSELSSGTHHGADQVTLEARCYGLAKRYSPFLINTVVGFIGPEYLYDSKQITRAGLEDHFMGKLTGLPMGCDACYTNHAKADQNDVENLALLLTAAGCNYFMGVPMGDDCMLYYQCTSYHDIATLRQLLNLRPAPEFEKWMEEQGLMRDGKLTKRAGDASFFLGK